LALSAEHPRYGYRRIATLLRREGCNVGKRQIQRLRRDEGLRVPPSKRKLARRGVSTGLPTTATHRNHVWTWDFIADATMRGGALRLLTILDEYTREGHVLRAERALKSAEVLAWLQKAIVQHGAPEQLRSDNGSEFIAKIVQRWLKDNGIKPIYIAPGSPVAERVCGKFSRAFPGRMLEPGTTVDADGSAGRGGRLPAGIQSGAAAPPVGR
jgi:transposase InsO family protein